MSIIREYKEIPEALPPRTNWEVQCDACPAVFTRTLEGDNKCSLCKKDFCRKHPLINGQLHMNVQVSATQDYLYEQVHLVVNDCCEGCLTKVINPFTIRELIANNKGVASRPG
jgi:phage tail protein X